MLSTVVCVASNDSRLRVDFICHRIIMQVLPFMCVLETTATVADCTERVDCTERTFSLMECQNYSHH